MTFIQLLKLTNQEYRKDNMWYSIKGAFPVEGLPVRIRLENGQIRTDPSSYTEQELVSAQIVAVPAPPEKKPYEKLLWENNSWSIVDPRTVESEKLRLFNNLSDRRKEAEENFTFAGANITLDEGTQSRIDAALNGLERSPVGTTTPWQVSQSTFIEFDVTSMQALALAAFSHVKGCFENSKMISLAIASATTLEELDQIDLELGWP